MKIYKLLFISLIGLGLSACGVSEKETFESKIIRYDNPESSILKGAFIPSGKGFYLTSGLVAPVKDETAEIGTYERYGNTYEQSVATLERIKATLEEGRFAMEDIVFLRVYLAPHRETGEVDFDAWFKAYGEFFNNEELQQKVGRSTIAVHSLAHPDLLIEIEAVAAQ